MTYDRSCDEENVAWEEDVMTQSLVLNALSSIINFSSVEGLNGVFSATVR